MVANIKTSISELPNIDSSEGDRLYYMDHLRTFIISLVIVEHTAIPYMMTENQTFWFFWDENTTLAFSVFVILANVIIRPILFFISGFFFFPSLLKKGPKQLIQSKLVRLGIPLVLGTTFINPFAFYIANLVKGNDVGNFFQYWLNDWLTGKDTAVAHLWFLQSLLVVTGIYCFLYALKPSAFTSLAAASSEWLSPLSQLALFGGFLALGLSITTAAVGGNVYTAWNWLGYGLLYVEPARFVNYLFYFGLGILLRQNFEKFSCFFPFGKRIEFWSLTVSFFATALVLFALNFELTRLDSYGLILIASLLRVLTSLSSLMLLILLFEKYFNLNSPSSIWLSKNSYAVYVIHLPIVVGLQALFLGFSWSAYTKFLVVTISSLATSYLFGSTVLRRLPVMNRVL